MILGFSQLVVGLFLSLGSLADTQCQWIIVVHYTYQYEVTLAFIACFQILLQWHHLPLIQNSLINVFSDVCFLNVVSLQI
jgi:hypothetical protein